MSAGQEWVDFRTECECGHFGHSGRCGASHRIVYPPGTWFRTDSDGNVHVSVRCTCAEIRPRDGADVEPF